MEAFEEYFEIIQESMSLNFIAEQVFKSEEGSGKSGSLFFKSDDNKFIVKTISGTELKLFNKILPLLIEHYK